MIAMLEYSFIGALTLLGLIVTLFLKLYPKVREFIDAEEGKYRKQNARFFVQMILDLYTKYRTSIPPSEELQKFILNTMESADKFWNDVKQAKKLRDNLDTVIISLIIGVITFFITPLMPMPTLSWLVLIIGISATIIGLLVLFRLTKKLY